MDPKRLGDILIESGRLTPAQLEKALARKTPDKRLGMVLQELGMLTEKETLETIAEQFEIPFMDSDMFLVDPLVVDLIPEQFARKNDVIPLFLVDNELTVAMSDPLDIPVVDELRRLTGNRIHCVLAASKAIKTALDEYYSISHSIEKVISSFEDDIPDLDQDNAPAIRLVNQILYHSIKLNASDIHIEPLEKHFRVRFRIDGILHEIFSPPKALGDVVTSRIKIMAKLDISEKRMPQDGRFTITIGDRTVDVRLSTLPLIHGEKLVLRILDKSSLVIGLDLIGLDKDESATIKTLLNRTYGLLLTTGPTGSGKTTTLYSMIQYMDTPDKNIVTVEDPVEYEFNKINQLQVNSKINLTFSQALRSILRQDPDVILVGEIRDTETASIAIRSALTGHLVLSTLHTNDAISTIGRLIDMSVPPYLLASALVGVVSQRLVRKVCVHCVEYSKPDPTILAHFGIPYDDRYQWPISHGCPQCNNTGYKGRTAVFEIVVINNELRKWILNSSSSVEMSHAAHKVKYQDLRTAGIKKVLQGITTMEEIERVSTNLEG